MNTRFDAVDFSKLPVPDALETWSFQAILDARMEDFVARWTIARDKNAALPLFDVGALESDPAKLIQEADTYREGLIRQRINDAVRATYLSSARDNDLTNRAADYMTARAAGETDKSLRKRAQLAWENLSAGGSYGGYAYRALSVAPADIADVAVWGYEVSQTFLFGAKVIPDFTKGEVRIALLGASQSGAVASSLIARVQSVLEDRRLRKVNDAISVVQATLCSYTVDARLILKRGCVPDAIIAAAKSRANAYARATRIIGVEATRGGFQAALMQDQPGLIVDLELFEPGGPVGGGPFEAPVLSGVHIDWRYA